jgi:hypothetical protein
LATSKAVEFYKVAKQHLNDAGFQAEIQWQAQCSLREFTESDLLREAAWVVLCTGFRESFVRTCFSFISICFCEWESAAVICENADLCRATALSKFGNMRKIEAIINAAKYVRSTGFDIYRTAILQDPIPALRRLPYIGGVTAFHLAKNLGADLAKPDRHLSRLAAAQGFYDAHALCSAIAQATGDPRNVIDLILWRYLEQGHRFNEDSIKGKQLTNGGGPCSTV